MELFEWMRNIRNLDIEEKIILAINETKNDLKELTYERTCWIYSSYLYELLKNDGVSVKLVSTTNLGSEFLHYFLLVYSNRELPYYLIDLTFEQFKKTGNLQCLVDNGFQLVDEEIWHEYLNIIQKDNISRTLDDAFYGIGHSR